MNKEPVEVFFSIAYLAHVVFEHRRDPFSDYKLAIIVDKSDVPGVKPTIFINAGHVELLHTLGHILLSYFIIENFTSFPFSTK
jgi:hypothetical protein